MVISKYIQRYTALLTSKVALTTVMRLNIHEKEVALPLSRDKLCLLSSTLGIHTVCYKWSDTTIVILWNVNKLKRSNIEYMNNKISRFTYT